MVWGWSRNDLGVTPWLLRVARSVAHAIGGRCWRLLCTTMPPWRALWRCEFLHWCTQGPDQSKPTPELQFRLRSVGGILEHRTTGVSPASRAWVHGWEWTPPPWVGWICQAACLWVGRREGGCALGSGVRVFGLDATILACSPARSGGAAAGPVAIAVGWFLSGL